MPSSRRPRLALALAVWLLLANGCAGRRAAGSSLATRSYPAPGGPPSCLIVLLPGQRDRLGAFERHDFPEVLTKGAAPAAAIEADLHRGYYEAGTAVERLHQDVILPARAAGYQRVWLVGISMGGLGALLYAKEYPAQVSGLFLLSPFLGDSEILPEIAAAGGLARWTPGPGRGPRDDARGLWRFLKRYAAHGERDLPSLYIGYGTDDDLAASHRLLAGALPAGHVFTIEGGGHTWGVWRDLWEEFLREGPIERECSRASVRDSSR